MTHPRSIVRPKTRPASSGSDRQQRYRAKKTLVSIDVSAATRKGLQVLRDRLKQPSDAVLQRALALLAALLDHKEHGDGGKRNVPQHIDIETVISPRGKRTASKRAAQEMSPGDDDVLPCPTSACPDQMRQPPKRTAAVQGQASLPFGEPEAPPSHDQLERRS